MEYKGLTDAAYICIMDAAGADVYVREIPARYLDSNFTLEREMDSEAEMLEHFEGELGISMGDCQWMTFKSLAHLSLTHGIAKFIAGVV